MRKILAPLLALILALAPILAEAQQQIPTMPPNTVFGRGAGGGLPGPGAAIPFSTFSAALFPSGIPNSLLAPGAANTVKGTVNGSSEADLAVPSCSGANQSLDWTSGTGFGCVTASVPNPGNPGYVSVYYNGTAWVAQLPNGTFLNTSSSTTCAIQEAINYAWTTSPAQGVVVYGQGTAQPCNMTGVAISVPAGQGNSFLCLACVWSFTNTTQDGIDFDTQKLLSWKMPGALINYSGNSTQVAIKMAPVTSVNGNIWSLWSDYDFGFVKATGNAPNALFFINLGVNGASQPASSNFGNNKIHFAGLFGGGFAQYNIRYPTPAGSFNAGGENWIDFNDNQDATTNEIYIGSTAGSALDANLGTNHYKGNVGHTTSTASTQAMFTDSTADEFEFTSINCYQSVGTQFNVGWGPNAGVNVINTTQAIGCGGGQETGSAGQAPNAENYLTGVWRSYTPTLSCGSGTLTTASATGSGFVMPGAGGSSHTMFITFTATITTVGTCAGQLKVTLPVNINAAFNGTFICRETASNGDAYTASLVAGNGFAGLQRYDNNTANGTAWVSGYVLTCSGEYEI